MISSLDKDRTERAAIWHKEKLELIAAQQSVLDRIEAERSEREAAERDEREADEKENARTSAYIKDLEARVAKIAWRQLIPKPSLYDVVNITSNIVALAGFIVLFQWVGILAFTITACTFYAIVQDVKKAHRGWSAFFGSVGAFVIEAYYSYSHLHLFEELLKGNTYPFGVAYQTVALAFTVLISGGSVYAVIMTALRSHSDAEKKRCDDIDAAAAALKP